MTSVLDLDFLLITGKGGTGRTTLSASLAIAASKRGKKTLLAVSHPDDKLRAWFGTEASTQLHSLSEPGLDMVLLEPRSALKEYGRLVLKSRLAYNAIFETPKVLNFLLGVPGMQAWAMLGKAYYHAVERKDAQKRYDLVIVDAPATGHTLDMLRVPEVIAHVAPRGLLRREAESALALFADPTRSGALLVTLPEEMPTSETLELESTLRNELHWSVRAVVMNQHIDNPMSDDEVEALRILETQPEAAPIMGLIRLGQVRAARGREQIRQLKRLRDEHLNVWPVPKSAEGVHTRADLAKITHALEQFGI